MNEEKFILSEMDYNKLNAEYNKQLKPDMSKPLYNLQAIINALSLNGFELPIDLQNSVISHLSQALNLLLITHSEFNIYPNMHKNLTKQNPFLLINELCSISELLTSYTFKSPYQILCLKANKLILNTLQKITNYFSNKNIKIYKFI